MIIQCEQCQTKFKLDDSKVTAKGVNVRCAKCKHVFTVKKDEELADSALKRDFGALLDESTAFGQEEMAASEVSADFGVPEPAADSSFDMKEISFEDEKPAALPAADDFSLSSLEDDQAFAGQAGASEMDFSGMDFGEVSVDADKTMLAGAAVPDFGDMTMVQAPAQVTTAKDYEEIDFGQESLFGDAVSVPVHEEPSEPIKFEFSEDFSDSFGATGKIGEPLADETKAEEPFSLGEIDFGDELSSVAVQQIHPDELKPAQEFLFTPLGETHDKLSAIEETKQQSAPQPEPQIADEMPPLSISSRRKQSPLLAGLIALLAVVVVAVLGYLGYNLFADGKAKTAVETGRISLRSVKASFIKNPSAGEMLVITGEAVNEYSKPRAALQVKGSVFSPNGQILASKNAYCGNPLTYEQLATMPVEKIEAAMANQFGDSLANMEIAPGQAIPFVVVIPNLPAEAKDYAVEPAGSTVATAK